MMYLVFVMDEEIIAIINQLDLEWVGYKYFNKILSI